jgi:signal transduction histidine kinase
MATIVAVDDREDDLALLTTLLPHAGHRVLRASSGGEALELVRDERPDLLITDMWMPGLNGVDLARAVRSDPAADGIRILLYSAHGAESELAEFAVACAADGVVRKPIEPLAFLGLVSELLGEQLEQIGALEDSNRRLASDLIVSKQSELLIEVEARRQAAIAELGRAALKGVALEEILQLVVDTTRATLDCDHVVLVERTDDGMLRRATAGATDAPAFCVLRDGSPCPGTGAGALHAAREGATATAPRALPCLEEHGFESGISAPIGGHPEPFGALCVFSSLPRRWTDGETAYLETLAIVLTETIEGRRAKAEAEATLSQLKQSNEERGSLLRRLAHAQEAERQSIASDIHDDSAQVMTALVLRLGLLKMRIEDPEIKAMLVETTEVARQSISRLRHLMFELRPPALDRDGLAGAIRLYLDGRSGESDLAYEVAGDVPADLDPATSGIIYRIAQESLANVHKHAGATTVTVELEADEQGVLTRVADDGCGFDMGDPTAPGHLGLPSMYERAQSAGGWCRVDSTPGSGTTVEFYVPVAA